MYMFPLSEYSLVRVRLCGQSSIFALVMCAARPEARKPAKPGQYKPGLSQASCRGLRWLRLRLGGQASQAGPASQVLQVVKVTGDLNGFGFDV